MSWVLNTAPLVLLAPDTYTGTGVGPVVRSDEIQRSRTMLLVCNVTAFSGPAMPTPTLDVAVQAKYNTKYINIARFSRFVAPILGQRSLAIGEVNFGALPALEVEAAEDPPVGTGLLILNYPWITDVRIKFTISGLPANSFTFGVETYLFS